MLNFLQSLFLPCLNKIILHLRNRINLNKMKMKIAFRYYSFLSAQFTDKIFYHERHYYKIVTVLVNPKNKVRNVCLRSKTTLFSGKKKKVVRLSSINGNFATNNAREIFSKFQA
jgi:hypothetical protein